MKNIYILLTGFYEMNHIEEVSLDPHYIIKKAITISKKNELGNEFSEIKIWTEKNFLGSYGISQTDKINFPKNILEKKS